MPRALMASRGERPFLSAWMEMPKASGDAEEAKPRGSK